MIIVKVMGGLGNQMFQASFARSISMMGVSPVMLDISYFECFHNINGLKRKYELELFNQSFQIATKEEINFVKNLGFIKRIFLRFSSMLSAYFGYIFETDSKYKRKYVELLTKFESRNKNVYVDGYWQSEKYFIKCEKEIRKGFSFKKLLTGENEKIAKDISKTNSVSLHVRRNDYVNSEVTNKFHGTCGLDYYQRAINLINRSVKNPKYFVFSDDMEWVKKNFKIKKAVYVEGNIGDKSYIDMQLMSLCKHNIIANSSFSWWGAWLNDNLNKIVIAPKKWFNDSSIDTTDLIPEKWIKI